MLMMEKTLKNEDLSFLILMAREDAFLQQPPSIESNLRFYS